MNNTTVKDKKQGYAGLYNRFFKRIVDIVIAGCALLVLWPLYLVIALAIIHKVRRNKK